MKDEESRAGEELAAAHWVSVVLPVHDERDSLAVLVDEIRDVLAPLELGGWEILICDDGSLDDSVEVAERCRLADPDHVIVLRLRRNYGQTAALAAGFDHARGDVLVPMDADLQNDPRDIPRLLARLDDGFDVVKGWRRERKDFFLSRRFPSLIANRLIAWTTGIYIHDNGCTLAAYRREILQDVSMYGELHRFLPALAFWAGGRVVELEVNHRPRRFGRTKYGLSRTIRVLLDLLTVNFLLRYSTKPMQIFGRWGIWCLLFGGFMGVLTVLLKLLPPHHDVTGNPWMYLCIFFSLGGLQLLATGLIGEITIRTYHESQGKAIYALRERVSNPQPQTGLDREEAGLLE